MTSTSTFRSLHEAGTFVMPNPWDRGSAKIMQEAGCRALATTSSGYAQSIGKVDQELTLDELVAHAADLAAFISVPLNVDSERLFPDGPGGIAGTVRRLADAGAAGCSIEDYDPISATIDPIDVATEAVSVAAAACAEHGLVLTARAENHLYRSDPDLLTDTVSRLQAYQAAGADVLYAPGLSTAADIDAVVSAVDRPINVLARTHGPSVPELEALGVRRVSVGGAMYNATARRLVEVMNEMMEHGTSHYAR